MGARGGKSGQRRAPYFLTGRSPALAGEQKVQQKRYRPDCYRDKGEMVR